MVIGIAVVHVLHCLLVEYELGIVYKRRLLVLFYCLKKPDLTQPASSLPCILSEPFVRSRMSTMTARICTIKIIPKLRHSL